MLILIGVNLGKDAQRRGRNGRTWGILFVFNPVIFGLAYLVVRKRASPSMRSEWLPAETTAAWPISSRASLRIDRLLVVPTGLAALIAFGLIIIDLTTQRPVAGLDLLLVPGIPLLAIGQVWLIVVQQARLPKQTGSWRTRAQASASTLGGQLERFFGGLPRPMRTGVFAAFFIGWLAGVTAFPSISNGGPSPATPTCPWPLSDHGVTTCVSHATYLHAEAGLQRFAAGILMGFFVVHFGVELSEVRRRSGGTDTLTVSQA